MFSWIKCGWTLFTIINIVNPRKFLYFDFKKCTFITLYLYYITFASNYKKLVKRLWEGRYIWHHSLFWLPFSVSQFFERFSFAIWANGTLPFTALEVNPTMMTSAAEKPRNVKRVHYIWYKLYSKVWGQVFLLFFFFYKSIVLFSREALHLWEVTVKTFIMLQKIISNDCCSFELSIH